MRAADYLTVGRAQGSLVDITEFKYGIGSHFVGRGGQTLAQLRTLSPEAWQLLPGDRAVVFANNHDTQRADAVYYQDGAAHELANVFLLAWPYGQVAITSSYAFDRATAAGRDTGPPSSAAGVATCFTPAPPPRRPPAHPTPRPRRPAAGCASTASARWRTWWRFQAQRGRAGHQLVGQRRQSNRLCARRAGLRRHQPRDDVAGAAFCYRAARGQLLRCLAGRFRLRPLAGRRRLHGTLDRGRRRRTGAADGAG